MDSMPPKTETGADAIGTRDGRREPLELLERSEQLYRTLVESSRVLVWRCDAEGKVVFLNAAWEPTLGYRLEELLGRPFDGLRRPDLRAADERLAGDPSGFVTEYELTQRTRDGRQLHLLFHAVALRDGEGRVLGSQGTAEDVTEQRLVEAYRAAGSEILQILNEPGSLRDAIRRVLVTLRGRTGFDAVGLRLKDGDDFPYFVQEGFSEPFLKSENTLLRRDAEGGVCRGKDGEACLACTCGLVIAGKPSPFLTARGSFWTNDSVELLDLPIAEDPRLDPRNQCIHHGFASVALVPIRAKERIVGLVQLNARRKGRFTAKTIDVLEGVASQIGEALVRKQMEAALQESEQNLREHQEKLQGMAFEAAVVQERERRRIAVDLHDSIGQLLALAQIKLGAVREGATGAPRAAIEEVLGLLGKSIAESRSLVFALSPPILYDLGLDAAISWLAEEVEKSHGLLVTLTADGAVGALDDTTAVIVFRAVRELLMNVFKHAQSPAARVSLRGTSELLEVVVEDEGVGFDPVALTTAPSGGSFGLFSLREQITRVGGTVELTSAKGEGTRACVRVPLKRSG